jgi:hypothetical protein
MAQIQVGVGVDEVDQGLSSVATGSDEGDFGRLSVGVVLLPERRVRVRRGVGADSLNGN